MSREDEIKEKEKEKDKDKDKIKTEVKKIKERRKRKNRETDKFKLNEQQENIELEDLELEQKIKEKKLKSKKRFCTFLIIILLLIILLLVIYIIYESFFKPFVPIKKGFKMEFDGVRLDVVDLKSNSRPFAVMIDNNENAWPQFNINEALVVYEMHVEGGLSRLMAIYKDKPNLTKVGPLRSARHYFLDYVKEYDAIYVHEGYSPRALNEIYSRNIDTVVYTSGLFVRDNTRWAPHNAITSSKRMTDAAKKRGYSLTTKKTTLPLKYSRIPIKLEKSIPATTINTGFSSYATLKLVYNEKTKKYEKYEIGELLKDAVTKEPLAATNIIILYANSYPLTGYGAGKGRVDIDTTQNMTGYYFTRGEGVKIKAKKKTRNSQTKYTLEDGTELRINDGNTFIFLVPKSQKIKIKGEQKTEEQLLLEDDERKKYSDIEFLKQDERVKIEEIVYTDPELEEDFISKFIENLRNIFRKKDNNKVINNNQNNADIDNIEDIKDIKENIENTEEKQEKVEERE